MGQQNTISLLSKSSWKMRLQAGCYLFILAISLSFTITSYAQELTRESFTAGASSSSLLVYDSFDDTGHVDTIRDAVTESMDQFDSLFNDPVVPLMDVLVHVDAFTSVEATSGLSGSEAWAQSHYDVTPDFEFEEIVGEHVFSGSKVCYLEVQDSPVDTLTLQFEIAHEIARCFLANQEFYLDTDYGSGDSWLVSSIADFLASTVYPDNAGVILTERAGFNGLQDVVLASETIVGSSGLLTNTDYVAVYFWLYLSTLEGDAETLPATEDAVLDLLRNYTGLSYDDDVFHPYLNAEIENLSVQFGNFGVALARDALAGQPLSDDLFETPIPTDIPLTDTVSMYTDFSLRFKQFSTFIDVPAIEISVSELPEDTSIQVQVSGDELVYQNVYPDSPVVLCKEDDEILLNSVVSRAYEATGEEVVFDIIYTPLEEYEDCEDPETTSPDDSDEEEEDFSCLVGEFELVDLPAESFSDVFGDLAGASDITVGSMNLSIDEFLHVTHTADDFSVNTDMSGMDMLVTIDIAVSGNLNVHTVDGISFTVDSFNYSFDSITAMANIDGQTMDLSTLASDMVSEFGNAVFLPPVRLVCTDFGLDYHVSINGIESVWGYHAIMTE